MYAIFRQNRHVIQVAKVAILMAIVQNKILMEMGSWTWKN
jgi:hypothetical protein